MITQKSTVLIYFMGKQGITQIDINSPKSAYLNEKIS
jgi:hypothetical protein